MGGMLVATVTFALLVAVVLMLLVVVTVAPLFLALQMADARRFSTARWGLLSAATVLIGLAIAYKLHSHDLPLIVKVLPLVLTWAGPAGLWLLEEGQSRLGGRAGQHE